MKLSLRWIFDHLEASYADYSAQDIVKKLITSTAEIEHYQPVTYQLDTVALGQVKVISDTTIELFCPELDQKFTLSARKDAVLEHWYLINTKTSTWVTLKEWHSDKEGLLPAFVVPSSELKGEWKKHCEKDDVIIEVDNKSITNRPDLWGHRGFARELSVLLNVSLKKEGTLLKKAPLLTQGYANDSDHIPYSIDISTSSCSHIAVLPIKCPYTTTSLITMAARLARIDLKPMNVIVDTTNYVMADMAHPMHAFDADVYLQKKLIVRNANHEEQLTLLDGTVLNLTTNDMVIASEKEVLSLAGIKGGLHSGITSTTQHILLEAGCFDATTIRLSSTRHKLRTDASARFEKTLDPQGNVKAIERFLAVCDAYKVPYALEGCLVVAGPKVTSHTIYVTQRSIEDKIGMIIDLSVIVSILTTLGMNVTVMTHNQETEYKVEVPSYRSAKDIKIPEDIIEEIARVIGYDAIVPVLPSTSGEPHDHRWLYSKRKLKSYMAHTMQLSEVENYALYNNHFIKCIGYKPENALDLKNPLTQERTTLVTSLIPHLLENALTTYEHHEKFGFFEWARVFNATKQGKDETQMIAGLIYNKKAVDFYVLKQQLTMMLTSIGHTVEFRANTQKPWWSASYKVVDIYSNNNLIGTMGQLSEQLTSEFTKGQVLCFELYAQRIIEPVPPLISAQPLPDHQVQFLDVSCIVHQSLTTAQLSDIIASVDEHIVRVTLIDSYYKPEWHDKKSMTFRCSIYKQEKVLSKEELEELLEHIKTALEGHGAEVR